LTLDRVRLEPSRFVPHIDVSQPFDMRLYIMDAHLRDAAVLVDADELRSILLAAADAGGATVVGERFHVFPNGAVTGVLLLAQSHLSIHTWPELLLANIDLLSYGRVDGEAVMRVVGERLGVERATVESVWRGLG
jgi:S-adenosylmethionine decarboxylase